MPASRLVLLSMLVSMLSTMPVFAAAPASELLVTVTDQDGVPLQDAAVFLEMDGLAPQPPASAVMDQRDRQFVPYVLLVTPGTEVEFPNSDNIRHHVYSFSPARTFELKLYSGSSAEPVGFDRPGLVTLGCNIHDWMLGFILVSEAPRRAVTGSDGQARFQGLPAGEAVVKAWHPRLGSSGLTERSLAITSSTDLTITLEVGPKLRQSAPNIEQQLQRRDRQRDERREQRRERSQGGQG